MAIAVKVDFTNVYEIAPMSNDFKESAFNTELKDGRFTTLKIEISNDPHEMLPNVYNLAFGPVDAKGNINDKAQLSHKSYSKVFSTILLNALYYLKSNPDHYLGIDGSNNSRAFLYYRFMLRNHAYLDSHFNMFGLKYYVRITRFGKNQYDNPFDFEDIQPYPERLSSNPAETTSMYNYFIFNLK